MYRRYIRVHNKYDDDFPIRVMQSSAAFGADTRAYRPHINRPFARHRVLLLEYVLTVNANSRIVQDGRTRRTVQIERWQWPTDGVVSFGKSIKKKIKNIVYQS